MPISSQRSEAHVTVQLSDCAHEDAEAVFRALGGAFASDREAGDRPRDAPGDHPTVWNAVFDVSDGQGEPVPASLGGSVQAQLQGGNRAVDRLARALGEVFVVETEGASAGDQEKELDLLLRSR
ncbi:hypothetical protein [Streptomyces sp. MST-110588]|uniref:hypothetical protein n=1 Tax=Streptomyces sp. MST-110588 TaxID=2833628 RepID=UPI001F5E3105|nr:hypothetical protein [Streptomyces sp. MST-110588]UNO39299.1 hypothetical protein KGS77_06270 [Streptomyces sp. MST-110588]